jgi:hypothetical protein
MLNVRIRAGRRDNFYTALKYALCRFLHENGEAFILFVWEMSLTGDTLNCWLRQR